MTDQDNGRSDGQRRGEDRRSQTAEPYSGPERRIGERRSGKDRRGAPRS